MAKRVLKCSAKGCSFRCSSPFAMRDHYRRKPKHASEQWRWREQRKKGKDADPAARLKRLTGLPTKTRTVSVTARGRSAGKPWRFCPFCGERQK
jgi:hypothetical protein